MEFKEFTFVAVLSGGQTLPEVKVIAGDHVIARAQVWDGLTQAQRDNCEDLDLVEQEIVNMVTEVKLVRQSNLTWVVEVTKQFAPANGGGTEVFKSGSLPNEFAALDVARQMVVLSPAHQRGIR